MTGKNQDALHGRWLFVMFSVSALVGMAVSAGVWYGASLGLPAWAAAGVTALAAVAEEKTHPHRGLAHWVVGRFAAVVATVGEVGARIAGIADRNAITLARIGADMNAPVKEIDAML